MNEDVHATEATVDANAADTYETTTEAAPTEEATVDANTTVEEKDEATILREELLQAQAQIASLQAELEEAKQKQLRGLAELQTVRRRSADEVKRARDKGADGVVLAVLPVYDDLRRALEAVKDDPSSIIPGVEKVRETLKRNLEGLGISETGAAGEKFDPTYHEALTSMPTEDEALKGTIAQVFEAGFVKDARVVRPARVVVYHD